MFKMFDEDKSGSLDADEVKLGLERFGLHPTGTREGVREEGSEG